MTKASHAQDISIHVSNISKQEWRKSEMNCCQIYTSCQARCYSIWENLECLKKRAGISAGIFLVAEADREPHSKNLKFKTYFELWVVNVILN